MESSHDGRGRVRWMASRKVADRAAIINAKSYPCDSLMTAVVRGVRRCMNCFW